MPRHLDGDLPGAWVSRKAGLGQKTEHCQTEHHDERQPGKDLDDHAQSRLARWIERQRVGTLASSAQRGRSQGPENQDPNDRADADKNPK